MLVAFLFVWNISVTDERICAKFTRKTCLIPCSDEFEGQRSKVKVTRNKNGIFGSISAACMQLLHSDAWIESFCHNFIIRIIPLTYNYYFCWEKTVYFLYWAFVKRFALCYPPVVCLFVCLSCLSVTSVYRGQTVGRIKMKLGVQVGLGPGHIVIKLSLNQRLQS